MNAPGKIPEMRDHPVVTDVDLPVDRGHIARHDGRPPDHRHDQPAARLFLVIGLIPLERQAPVGIAGRMGGADDPVAQPAPAYRERLEQRGEPRAHPWSLGRLSHRARLLRPCAARHGAPSPRSVRGPPGGVFSVQQSGEGLRAGQCVAATRRLPAAEIRPVRQKRLIEFRSVARHHMRRAKEMPGRAHLAHGIERQRVIIDDHLRQHRVETLQHLGVDHHLFG